MWAVNMGYEKIKKQIIILLTKVLLSLKALISFVPLSVWIIIYRMFQQEKTLFQKVILELKIRKQNHKHGLGQTLFSGYGYRKIRPCLSSQQ